MGSKMMQVKGAGSQSFPAPAHIAPQCGAGNVFHRGRISSLGVGFGVREQKECVKTPQIKDWMGAAAGVTALSTEMEAIP